MHQANVNKIIKKVITGWQDRLPREAKILPEQIDSLRWALKQSPYEDGNARVKSLVTGKTYLVPYEEIILNGIKGNELNKYPIDDGKTK